MTWPTGRVYNVPTTPKHSIPVNGSEGSNMVKALRDTRMDQPISAHL
jgi:hypothetical protein